MNRNTIQASMKTTTPPRLRAKKEKKAPHNDAINQYSLVKIVFIFSKLIRTTEIAISNKYKTAAKRLKT
jgi:hypothetical protein